MKSCILLRSQNRNILFRSISFFSIVILLLMGPNHLNGQSDITSSYLIVPDSLHNEISMSPVVVINHSMIERFLTVSFPSGKMGLSTLIRNYSLDSIKTVLESEMRKNVAKVSESETNPRDEPDSENKLNTYPNSRIANSSN